MEVLTNITDAMMELKMGIDTVPVANFAYLCIKAKNKMQQFRQFDGSARFFAKSKSS